MSWAVTPDSAHTSTLSLSIGGQYWIGVTAFVTVTLTQHHVRHVRAEDGVGGGLAAFG